MKKILLLLIFPLSFYAFGQLNIGALYFDGVNDEVSIPNTYGLSSTANFTVEAWIRANTQPVYSDELNIIGNQEYLSGIDGFRISLNNGYLTYFGVNGGFGAGPNLLDSICHHVAVVRQSSVIHLYVDGVSYLSPVIDTTDLNSSEPYLLIGAKDDPIFPRSFHGLIKEVRFWNIARTGSQIASNMNTIISSQPNLMGYWRCDDSTGQSVHDYALGNNGVLGTNSLTQTSDPGWTFGCISFPTLVEDVFQTDTFHLFPNPATSEIRFEGLTLKAEQIDVFDVVGKKVSPLLINSLNGTSSSIDISILPSGIYFVAIKDENTKLVVRKFVKM